MRIQRVAVVGAGTMGRGIAQVAAAAGYSVLLNDVSPEAVAAGLEKIRATLDKGVRLGKVTEEAREGTLSHLGGAPRLDAAVGDADLVIEAIPERSDLKAALFSQVAAAAPPQALLATNTSSLSVADLAVTVPDPSRFLGLHFFNPVHIMLLVEVVHGPSTSPDTLAAGLAFARSLGKEPISVKDSPGFASSRLGVIMGLEAMRMVEEGVASAADIDKAMEVGYRHPMGPLRLTDLVGLDVRLGIAEHLHLTLGAERFRPPAILRRMVAEGKLGKKSGVGFYDWPEVVKP